MTQVMRGVRVLEVAQFIFAPSAGALLADWGADVLKIEHPVYADGQRGFLRWGGAVFDPNRNPLIEGVNRGKRSVGLDIANPAGRELLYELARTADGATRTQARAASTAVAPRRAGVDQALDVPEGLFRHRVLDGDRPGAGASCCRCKRHRNRAG